jgi:hypothetical protein
VVPVYTPPLQFVIDVVQTIAVALHVTVIAAVLRHQVVATVTVVHVKVLVPTALVAAEAQVPPVHPVGTVGLV